jgi:4-diphosphocytidyl-2-C-methyl-D-erythritol kinase
MVKLLREFAPAKVNLFLRVTGRRPDGYHELDSIFLPVAMGDQLQIQLRPNRPRSATVTCDAASLPCDESNLAVRAAYAFMTEFAIEADVAIEIQKRIPIGAGLGGGSSDAGAVLRMLAALCRINEAARLARIALELGADVPFFLNPVPARVGGIGERIIPLPTMAGLPLLIIVPPLQVETASVFRALRQEHWSGPASDEEVRAVATAKATSHLLVNDLAEVTMVRWPEIARLKTLLENAGAQAATMTGSGSAVFGVFSTQQEASAAAQEIHAKAKEVQVFVTASFPAST